MIDASDSAGEANSSTAICPVRPPGSAPQADCGPSSYRLPQFTLKFIALATAMIAVWFALWPMTSVSSRAVLAVILLTYLFGCTRTRRSVLVMLPTIYVPHLWIFLIKDYPWTEYRWLWAKMFWQLPGVLPEALLRTSRRYNQMIQLDLWRFHWIAFCAILIWVTAVWLGRRGGRQLWVVAAVTFVLSVISARIEQALFRM